jgi:hypothetical protein
VSEIPVRIHSTQNSGDCMCSVHTDQHPSAGNLFDGRKAAADVPHSDVWTPAPDTTHVKCVGTVSKMYDSLYGKFNESENSLASAFCTLANDSGSGKSLQNILQLINLCQIFKFLYEGKKRSSLSTRTLAPVEWTVCLPCVIRRKRLRKYPEILARVIYFLRNNTLINCPVM